MKNLCSWCIRLQQSYKQHMLSMIINSTQNYSSSRRLQFDCMLSIAKYSNRLNMKSLSPDNTRYCKKYTLKHYYNSHIMLILLNRQCSLWMPINSNLTHMLNKHLKFSYKYCSLRYQSKQGMKMTLLDNIHQSNQCMHLSFDCNYCNLQYQSRQGMMLNLLNSNRCCRKCTHLKFNCNYYNLQCWNISNKKWRWPNSNHYCKLCTHLKFSCRLNIKNLGLNIISNLQNQRDSSLIYKLCKQRRLRPGNQHLILLCIK